MFELGLALYDYIIENPAHVIINILVVGFWISVIMVIYSFIKEKMCVDDEEVS